MTEILQCYYNIVVPQREYCVLCFRTSGERRLVGIKCLENFLKSANLLSVYKNHDLQKICYICERQAIAAYRFQLAVKLSADVHDLYRMMAKSKKLRDDVYKQLNGLKKPVKATANINEWETLLLDIRSQSQLLQTEVLVVDSLASEKSSKDSDGDDPGEPANVYLIPDSAPLRPPTAWQGDGQPPEQFLLSEPEVYMDSVVNLIDEDDPIDIKNEDPIPTDMLIDNTIMEEVTEILPDLPEVRSTTPTVPNIPTNPPKLVPIEQLLETEPVLDSVNGNFILHPIVEKNGIVTVPSLSAQILNGQLIRIDKTKIVVQTPKLAIQNGVNFEFVTKPKDVIDALKTLSDTNINNIAVISDDLQIVQNTKNARNERNDRLPKQMEQFITVGNAGARKIIISPQGMTSLVKPMQVSNNTSVVLRNTIQNVQLPDGTIHNVQLSNGTIRNVQLPNNVSPLLLMNNTVRRVQIGNTVQNVQLSNGTIQKLQSPLLITNNTIQNVQLSGGEFMKSVKIQDGVLKTVQVPKSNITVQVNTKRPLFTNVTFGQHKAMLQNDVQDLIHKHSEKETDLVRKRQTSESKGGQKEEDGNKGSVTKTASKDTDWEDKIPMDVISFMNATDPNASKVLNQKPSEPALGIICNVRSIADNDGENNSNSGDENIDSTRNRDQPNDSACTFESVYSRHPVNSGRRGRPYSRAGVGSRESANSRPSVNSRESVDASSSADDSVTSVRVFTSRASVSSHEKSSRSISRPSDRVKRKRKSDPDNAVFDVIDLC